MAAKVGEPLITSMTVEVALRLIDDREAATDAELVGRWCWWGRYTCAWRAGAVLLVDVARPWSTPYRI
jgi:hypothetical protein